MHMLKQKNEIQFLSPLEKDLLKQLMENKSEWNYDLSCEPLVADQNKSEAIQGIVKCK